MNDSDILGSRRAIFAWLWLLIGMVFCMVVVGGVTRLTGSGLSIVEWAPIMGTLPPCHADRDPGEAPSAPSSPGGGLIGQSGGPSGGQGSK